MAGKRSSFEAEILKIEAERRARAGESRTDISRALGVPLTTLTYWAQQGRWLRRDLEAERLPELTVQTIDRIIDARFGATRRQAGPRQQSRPKQKPA